MAGTLTVATLSIGTWPLPHGAWITHSDPAEIATRAVLLLKNWLTHGQQPGDALIPMRLQRT